MRDDNVPPPILANKHYASPSTFTAQNLVTEIRRQKQAWQQTVRRPASSTASPPRLASQDVAYFAHVTNRGETDGGRV